MRHLDQLRDAAGDVVKAAREDSHVVAEDMDLHACAVELPFDSGGRDALERGRDRRRRLRQHRLHRLTDLQPKLLEPDWTTAPTGLGNRADVAPQHDGAPDV